MLLGASTLLAQTGGWPAANESQQQTAETNQSASPYSEPAPSLDQNRAQNEAQNQQYSQAPPPYANEAPPPYANDQGPSGGNGGPGYGSQAPPSYAGQAPSQNNDPQFSQRGPYGQNPNPYYQQAPAPVPAQLTITPGMYVTVRINQKLSSDHNRPGDTFTATLAEPLVVNGVVVAEPGETVGGVVSSVEKGDHATLVVQLNELTLVDGQNLPIQTQLVARRGPGFNGNDAGTIVGTTGAGAVIGGVTGGGPGAAIGAVAGLTLGALVTNHHPSVLYPEQILTFRIQAPVTVNTTQSANAFHYIEPGDYDRAPAHRTYMADAPAPYYYGYPAYPYYWGPSFGFAYFGGPHYYHYYRGGGYYRPYAHYGVRGGIAIRR
jgi:hypothetical protein